VARASRNEIVYRDQLRFGYPTLIERISRLAGVLTGLGAQPGQTIAVMDWDSHRYLEAYFAIPMIGCVLQTANVRLSPEQLLYTLKSCRRQHHSRQRRIPAAAGVLIRQAGIGEDLHPDRRSRRPSERSDPVCRRVRATAGTKRQRLRIPGFRREHARDDVLHLGTTGLPKGVYYSHRQIVLNTWQRSPPSAPTQAQGRIHNEDVYMPITPLFHVHGWGMPYAATLLGIKQVYPGRYVPDMLIKLIRDEAVTFTHGVPTVLHMLMNCPQAAQTDLSK